MSDLYYISCLQGSATDTHLLQEIIQVSHSIVVEERDVYSPVVS